MCKSSAKSIGFMLLLWIGIVIPVTGDQLSHFVGSSDLGAAHHTSLDDDGDGTALAQDADANDDSSSFASTDLSDFIFVSLPPQVSLPGDLMITRRLAAGFSSRELAPQERPPNTAAA
jgi:hypothetical protein